MASFYRYDNRERFFTINEFSNVSGCSKEEIITYIENGYLFPLAPTRQRVLIRRIPSLLTEYLFNFESDEDRYEEIVNKPAIHLGYAEYIDTWRDFIKRYQLYAQSYNKDLSEQCQPKMSDIQFTNGEFVYIGPDVVKEISLFGEANIKRFVSSRLTRGFYHPDSYVDINKLYDRFKLSNVYVQAESISAHFDTAEANDEKLVSIYSRFSIEFKGIYNKNPSLCYPDYSYSMDYLGILGDLLPVTLWAAAHYLDLRPNDFLTRYFQFSPSWLEGVREIESKLHKIISNIDNIQDGYLFFFNLVKLSSYSDQWVPLYPERNELVCTYDSLRLSSNQIEYAKSLKYEAGTIETFHDNSRRDYINYNYSIQRSFIFQLMQYIKNSKSDNISHKSLKEIVKYCIEKAQHQLENDDMFKVFALNSSGVVSTENFFNLFNNINKDPCYGLFVTASKKSKTKGPRKKDKASPERPVQNADSKSNKPELSVIKSSNDINKLFSPNKPK